MRLPGKKHFLFYSFLAAVTLVRLFIIPRFGLGVDEAHYVLYGRYLDLSYFDHPPLIGWVQFLFTSIFGDHEFGARIAAVLIGIVVSLQLYFFLLPLSEHRRLAYFSVMALNASFLFNALFFMLLPDTLLFLFIIPILHSVIAIENNNRVKSWLMLGLLLGLAGLAKYTAVLFLIPIGLYFLVRKRFDLLITPKMLPGIVLAFLLITPVLLWNSQHDWISFTYQTKHVAGSQSINWSGFLQSLAAQFVAYSPFLFPLAFFGLYRACRSQDHRLFLSALFGLTIFCFFTYSSLYERALPHWTSPFYLLFIPIGTYYILRISPAWKNYLYGAVALSLGLSLLAYAELAFRFLPFPDYKSMHRDLYGFASIMREANGLITNPAQEALAVTNWTVASRAIYYNSGYKSEVFLIDKRYDQFDLWQKNSPIGKDLIFINTHFFQTDVENRMQCEAVEKLKTIDLKLNGRMVNTIDYVLCRNFQGSKQ
jgi:4-amino-4-deoxy-L-arabinose transferase-like glycosyltransferase